MGATLASLAPSGDTIATMERGQAGLQAAGQPTIPYPAARLQHPKGNTRTPSNTESDHGGLAGRLDANSGAAFVRKLGLKIDPIKAPKLMLFGLEHRGETSGLSISCSFFCIARHRNHLTRAYEVHLRYISPKWTPTMDLWITLSFSND